MGTASHAKARARWVGTSLLTAWGILGAPGCLITGHVELQPPDGLLEQGSCMCAVCWDRPFCLSPTGEVATPAPDGSCPLDSLGVPMEASVPATAVNIYPEDRIRDFYCIQPMGRDVDATDDVHSDGLSEDVCPADEEARARLENVDPCVDVPEACRPLTGMDCGDPPGGPACPAGTMVGARRTGCGPARLPDGSFDETLGRLRAREKVLDSCAVWGRDVPSGATPARYCFTACIGDIEPRSGPFGGGTHLACDPELVDPPEVTQSSFPWRLEGSGSEATLTSPSGATTTVALLGDVALHAPSCGPLTDCAVALPWVGAYVDGEVVLDGYVVRNVRMTNVEPIRGATLEGGTGAVSSFELASGAVFYLTGEVDGLGLGQWVFTSPEPLGGTLDWTSRRFEIAGTFSHESGASLALVLRGGLPNYLPIADAGPDLVAECQGPEGALVPLSALGSSDPDGGLNSLISAWWTTRGNAFDLTANGFTTTVLVPLGSREYDLTVSDRWGAMSADEVLVTVSDTSGPVIDEVSLPAGDCLLPDGTLRLFRLGEEIVASGADVCSEVEPTYRIVSVTSNQPVGAGDVVFGDGALCLRAQQTDSGTGQPAHRYYTVTVEATDAAGNTSTDATTVTIVDLPSGMCQDGPASAPIVPAGDARCTEGGPAEPPPGCGCRLGAGTGESALGAAGVLALLVLLRGRRRRRR